MITSPCHVPISSCKGRGRCLFLHGRLLPTGRATCWCGMSTTCGRSTPPSKNGIHFETIAICVLPDHLHAIWSLPPGDTDFPLRWRLIKSGFSRRARRQFKAQPQQDRQAREGDLAAPLLGACHSRRRRSRSSRRLHPLQSCQAWIHVAKSAIGRIAASAAMSARGSAAAGVGWRRSRHDRRFRRMTLLRVGKRACNCSSVHAHVAHAFTEAPRCTSNESADAWAKSRSTVRHRRRHDRRFCPPSDSALAYAASRLALASSRPASTSAARMRSISARESLTSGGRTTARGSRPSSTSASFMRLCMSAQGSA